MNDNLIPILKDTNGYVVFLLQEIEKHDLFLKFNIKKCISWDMDDEIAETEDYMSGYVKWDGCSHVWFGEEDNGNRDGYLHLCGKEQWELHCKMMVAVYEYCSNNIKNFDRMIAR